MLGHDPLGQGTPTIRLIEVGHTPGGDDLSSPFYVKNYQFRTSGSEHKTADVYGKNQFSDIHKVQTYSQNLLKLKWRQSDDTKGRSDTFQMLLCNLLLLKTNKRAMKAIFLFKAVARHFTRIDSCRNGDRQKWVFIPTQEIPNINLILQLQ